ncbi:MAG: CHASE3 domain-containing protein [Burkholderiaceae bacterium]
MFVFTLARMRFSSSSMATAMLLAGTVAFIGTAVGEYLSLNELFARSTSLTYALQAKLLIRRTGALLVDLETGQRGFIITGQSAFLEPYERARQELDQAQTALREHLTEGGRGLPDALRRLEFLSAQRLAEIERNVGQRWAVGDAALKDVAGYVAGKRLMDEIRGELEQLEDFQDQQIARAEQGMQSVRRRTTVLTASLPAVGCLLIIGATLALQHERRRRDGAERELLGAKATLEDMVAQRTEQLRGALSRIRGFATAQDESVEAERRRLAREVHDQIGQIGTATKMLVLGLRKRLPPEFEGNLNELLALADEGIHTARNISASLRPPLLDDFGLAAALDFYAKALARQGELAVELDIEDDGGLSAAQANQLFRITQEAATNVLRHARAGRLLLRGRQQANCYLLEVIDDGQGPGSVRADAAGLRNMRERAALLGGSFEFGPGPAGGTRVAVRLPLVADPANEEDADACADR